MAELSPHFISAGSTISLIISPQKEHLTRLIFKPVLLMWVIRYSLLMYTGLFLSFITVMAIVLMAVGKYYSQTKALSQLKKRDHPSVDLHDQDAQHFVSVCIVYFWERFVFVEYYSMYRFLAVLEIMTCFVFVLDQQWCEVCQYMKTCISL